MMPSRIGLTIAIWLICAIRVAAEILCDLTLIPHQMMLMDVKDGDQTYDFHALQVQCHDVWTPVDSTTPQSRRWPIFVKYCTRGEWSSEASGCMACPLASEASLVPASDLAAGEQWEGCSNMMDASTGKCMCTKKDADGNGVPLTIDPVKVCSDGEGDCVKMAKHADMKQTSDWKKYMKPELKCPGLTFDPLPVGVKKATIAPPVAVDTIWTLYRMLFNFGTETMDTIHNSVPWIKHKLVADFIFAYDMQGVKTYVGPTKEELISSCTVKLNMWTNRAGTRAIGNNEDIAVVEAMFYTPPCDANGMKQIKNVQAKKITPAMNALTENPVVCTGESRRLSSTEPAEAGALPEDQRDTVLGRAFRERDYHDSVHSEDIVEDISKPSLEADEEGPEVRVRYGFHEYEEDEDEAVPTARRLQDSTPWTMTDGMQCSQKEYIQKKTIQVALSRTMAVTTMDAWIGCKAILDSFGKVETVTTNKIKKTRECMLKKFTTLGAINADWANDPCCNVEKSFEQCCAFRTVTLESNIVNFDSDAKNQIAAYANSLGVNPKFPIEAIKSYSKHEPKAAKKCFVTFFKSMAWYDKQNRVETCITEVNGVYSDVLGTTIGKWCKSDSACWTGQCQRPILTGEAASNVRSGGQKYCVTPENTASKDFVTPVIKCVVDKMYLRVRKELACDAGDCSATSVSDLVAKLQETFPTVTTNQCIGTGWDAVNKNEADCMAQTACNWDYAMPEDKCLSPCVGGDSCPQYCSEMTSGRDVTRHPLCVLTEFQPDGNVCAAERQTVEANAQAECDTCKAACDTTITTGGQALSQCYTNCAKCNTGDLGHKAWLDCMDTQCRTNTIGNDEAVYYHYGGACIWPQWSYDDSKKGQCQSECDQVTAPDSVANNQCYMVPKGTEPPGSIVAASVQQKFVKYEGMNCYGLAGHSTDTLRDFLGTADDCMVKCLELGTDCIGFVRVNQGQAKHTGRCYFRSGKLSTPRWSNGDNRDCYVPKPTGYEVGRFVKYEGYHCMGRGGYGTDSLRDYEGDADMCMAKCLELGDDCVGFVRVNEGNPAHEGKCYFRTGELTVPIPTPYNDDRDCYIPTGEVENPCEQIEPGDGQIVVPKYGDLTGYDYSQGPPPEAYCVIEGVTSESECDTFYTDMEPETKKLFSHNVWASVPGEVSSLCAELGQVCTLPLDAPVLKENWKVWDGCNTTAAYKTACSGANKCTGCSTSTQPCDVCCKCMEGADGYYGTLMLEGKERLCKNAEEQELLYLQAKYPSESANDVFVNYGYNPYYDARIFSGAGGCVHHIDTIKMMTMEERAACDGLWGTPNCTKPSASQASCAVLRDNNGNPVTTDFTFFKTTRTWREGYVANKTTCEQEKCVENPAATTEAECETKATCKGGDCATCETQAIQVNTLVIEADYADVSGKYSITDRYQNGQPVYRGPKNNMELRYEVKDSTSGYNWGATNWLEADGWVIMQGGQHRYGLPTTVGLEGLCAESYKILDWQSRKDAEGGAIITGCEKAYSDINAAHNKFVCRWTKKRDAAPSQEQCDDLGGTFMNDTENEYQVCVTGIKPGTDAAQSKWRQCSGKTTINGVKYYRKVLQCRYLPAESCDWSEKHLPQLSCAMQRSPCRTQVKCKYWGGYCDMQADNNQIMKDGGMCILKHEFPATALKEFEEVVVPQTNPQYEDLGVGKCLTQGGADPSYRYHHGIGTSSCRQKCDEDVKCGGYSVSKYNNCLVWRDMDLKGEGGNWGNARCHTKKVVKVLVKAPQTDFHAVCESKGVNGLRTESKLFGCMVNKVEGSLTRSECLAMSGGKWEQYAYSRATCEGDWKKSFNGKEQYFYDASGQGTHMCCTEFVGDVRDGYYFECTKWSLEITTKADCTACGWDAKWGRVFQWHQEGSWGRSEWKAEYEWKDRAMTPVNRWSSVLHQWKLNQIVDTTVVKMKAWPVRNYATCRLNPGLRSLWQMARAKFDKVLEFETAVFPNERRTTESSGFILNTFEDTISGDSPNTIQLSSDSADNQVGEVTSSRRLTNLRGDARKLVGGTTSGQYEASCYALIKADSKVVGQITGDCADLQFARPLDGSVEICFTPDESIPVAASYTQDGFASKDLNGEFTSMTSTIRMLDESGSTTTAFCGNFTTAGTYCPIKYHTDYTPGSTTAPGSAPDDTGYSCPTLSSLSSEIDDLVVANLTNFIKIDESAPNASFDILDQAGSAVSESGVVVNKIEFVAKASETPTESPDSTTPAGGTTPMGNQNGGSNSTTVDTGIESQTGNAPGVSISAVLLAMLHFYFC